MKVYTCTRFNGHWPVGTSAIVVASRPAEACGALMIALKDCGLDQIITPNMLDEIDLTEEKAIILNDGEY